MYHGIRKEGLRMIIEMDLGGFFKWIVVDNDLTILDPRYLHEFVTYFFS